MIPLSVWVNCNKICPQVDQLCPSVEKSNRISRERGQPQFMPMLTTTRTSELNTADSWNKEIYVVGSVNTIRLGRYGCETSTEGSLRRKIGEKEKEKEEE